MTANSFPPVDIETMRASADRLLASDAEVPATGELETLTRMLTGHLMVIIPDLERAAAARRDDDDMDRVCARTALAECHRKLRIDPGPGLSSRLAYARRMSRSLNALCDHYEKLCGLRPETGQ